MLEELQNIDTSAIEDLCAIKAEQETLHERLQRMEERREQVSELVYSRVRGDYEARHAELESSARPLKQQARAEYAKLQSLRTAMSEALDSARLAKEELDFRHELGEFTDDDFTARRDAAIEEVERCERELGEAEQLRERFVEAFHSEDELTVEEPETAPAPAEEAPEEEPVAAAEESPMVEVPVEEESENELVAEAPTDDDVPFDGDVPTDEPFESEPAAAEGGPDGWDDDSMATGILPTAGAPEYELDGEGQPDPVADEAEGDAEEAAAPASGDTPIPEEMMDDMPTGRMEVVAPEMVPPPPPVPGPPPPMPEPEGDGGEATAMFSLARLVAPGADGGEEEHALNPTETTIGRAPGNHIQINDGAISRQHAKIVGSLEGSYTIYDLGSENGVYVNRERIIDRRLKDGDIIEIGPGTKTFIYRGP